MELLVDLGMEYVLVGVIKFCVYLENLCCEKIFIGGIKVVKIEVIWQLNFDFVIGNKEENECSQIEKIEQEFFVWMSDIFYLNDVLDMIC